jgi:adenine-specific DNA-methyltransferase
MLFADDNLAIHPGDFWFDIKTTGLEAEGGVEFKNGKKPLKLLQRIIQMGLPNGGLALDFFAGSGSFAEAIWKSESVATSSRFILVQLPEPLSDSAEEQKSSYEFCLEVGRKPVVSSITKERLMRSRPTVDQVDTGFRVYKLDQSNIRAWQPSGNLEHDLIDSVEHIMPGRSEQDVLTELLLKLGLDLCVPIEQRQIASKTVHAIGSGALMACLDPRIGKDDAETLALGIAAWHKALAPAGDSTCVFRDSAFENDEAKTNLAAVLEQHGINHMRSL